ncbi:PREDICTED: uncharacterized protein LOC109238768 [Nicotiana attenuata]|uniref:uncharacterized protein LOC109238768 n=1 Tax=Nicotiana attenuata TaxID=49451 RepID=UPI0009058D79|nr:PREDICTED: uncharacterized protein LOC109238768 [Nicotiana attenuata]
MEIEVPYEEDYDDMPALECLEVEHFSDVTFNHLQEVKLILPTGHIPELQLMKLLLAKSPLLRRLLIESYLDKEDAESRIFGELADYQHASPEVEVSYQRRKHPYYLPSSRYFTQTMIFG